MIGNGSKNLVFDTSALVKIAKLEKGAEKVAGLLRTSRCFASSLSYHELLWALGKEDFKSAASLVSYLEELLTFVDPNTNDSKKSAILRIRHKNLGLSMADSIILQLGIDMNASIITSDKQWSKVEEAKVTIV